MPTFRSVAIVLIGAMIALVMVCSAAVSLAGTAARPAPAARLKAKTSPRSGRLRPGTPINFVLDTRFASKPPGGSFVLRRLDYLLPRNITLNGRTFPSCSVRTIIRAHGALRACPRGSKIGRGTVFGRIVELGGITSRARLTLFNGPGGRSITMNVSVKTPAFVNTTVSARLRRRKGSAVKLTLLAPPVLTTVLDGDIATSQVHLAIGATRTVSGVKRGYVEAARCPSSGRTRMRGTFTFRGNRKASAEAKVAC